MTLRLLAAVLLLLPWTAPAHALEPDLDVQQHVLANGATLLLVERHEAPVIAASIVFRVGSVDEPLGETGIAHMFEHMAFKGSQRIGTRDYRKERPLLDEVDRTRARRAELAGEENADPAALAQLDARIEALTQQAKELVIPNEYSTLYLRNGAVGLNASTGTDVTRYYVSFPSNRLPFWAAMEGDRLAHPVLREFYAERDVVIEERNMRVETSPTGKLYEAFLSAAFVAHPYGTPVIGWRSDLDQLTRPMARAFYARHYVPGNMVIALVGDLDPDEALRLVEATLGRIPAGPAAPDPYTKEPPQHGTRRVEVHFDAQPSLLMGYPKPSIHDDADITFDVLQSVLGGGRASRLYRTLVLERGLATDVSVDNGVPGARFTNLFTISADPRYPHTAAEVEAAILAEITRIREEPVSERELQRALNQVEASLIRRLDSNEGLAGSLSYFQAVAGDWRYLDHLYQTMSKLTPEQIMEAAKTYLTPDRLTVATLVPSEADAGETAAEAP